MIRREFQRPGEPPQWLLISQVEHARLSGVLAEHCAAYLPETVRAELLQAIVHHDDGWAAWDANPQLDESGCPLSFRELPWESSLPIWSESIDAALALGPLAAYCVAGHFLALLSSSDKPEHLAVDWRQRMIARRTKWLATWQATNPQHHTHAVANQSLHLLQLFDVMSLWLCSACPGQDEHDAQTIDAYRAGADQTWETRFSFERGCPRIQPWRFDIPQLHLVANGWRVPLGKYASTNALIAARKHWSVRWQLVKD